MKALRIDSTPYPLLRHLTLPVSAITTSAEGTRNAFIVNSAQRASLVPQIPRISLYISKTNFSHDLVYRSGVLGVHLLRNDQWDLIWQLGLQSARDVPDKLNGIELRTGTTGCPMLVDCMAAFECRVINAMDAGASTFFLADCVHIAEGTGEDVMTSTYFREHIPDEPRKRYEARLAAAHEALLPLALSVERTVWPGPVCGA